MKTPGPAPKSPMNDLTNVTGIKKMMATPRGPAKEPNNDLTDVQVIENYAKSDLWMYPNEILSLRALSS
jgi:hypothetical protein